MAEIILMLYRIAVLVFAITIITAFFIN